MIVIGTALFLWGLGGVGVAEITDAAASGPAREGGVG